MRLRTAFLLGAVLAVSGCSKQSGYQPDLEIMGTWNWESSSIGALVNTQTPQNTGVQEVLTFDDRGDWQRIINNILTGRGSFTRGIAQGPTGKQANAIHFRTHPGHRDSTIFYQVNDSILTFSTDFTGSVGGGARTYCRK